MRLQGKRIYVGLSGGVDSAVTAALLQEQGAQVIGVFIKGWYPPELPCTWAKDRRDAMRVAAHLSIPFTTLDASKEYKAAVIEYLIREYKEGRTPNPDIFCNKEVKFGAFYAFAKAHSADALATGHYARQEGGRLYRGIDTDKDQSYFLWAIGSDALAYTHFPLGTYRKQMVRAKAHQLRLPVASKKDSQGICFLGAVSVDDFLLHEFGEHVGEAVDESGAHVGTHTGVLLHTLGERIALMDAPPGPWYVIAKEVDTNILIVSKSKSSLAKTRALTIRDTNWFRDVRDTVLEAQYRYHGPRIAVTLDATKTICTPATPLDEPVASGQSLVLYDGEECVGGGILV